MLLKELSPPSLGRLLILSILILSAILLSSCTGLVYPNPIPCGDTDRLIQAIEIANSDSDPDTIELATGCVYELTTNYDNGNATGYIGLPEITSEITIVGHGAAIVRSSAEGTPKFRLILVGDSGNLFLQDLTLQNGYADDPLYPTEVERNSGGAIRNKNQLALESVTIQNNSANIVTGGIFNEGHLAMIGTSISGSQQDSHVVTFGALALQNYYDSSAIIVQSTFYGNNSPYYYVISNMETSTMYIENSTISGNNNWAIHTDGELDLIFSTIANNLLGIADIGRDSPNLDIIGSVFQNTSDCDFDSAVLTTNLNNMDSDGTCGFTYTVPASGQGLLPLANNGGATLTHALDPSSPAIDAVTGDCPVFEDQRDVTRPQMSICDIGAYEYDGAIPPVGGEIPFPSPTPVPPADEQKDEPEETFTPTPLPDRCNQFDSQNAKLTMLDIPYGSTELVVIVEYPHPIWGSEEAIPWDDRPWEYTATLGNAVAEKCTYRDYPGQLYCTFDLTKDYFNFAFPLSVMVNFCVDPIFYHKAVSVMAPEPPPTETSTPIACNANLSKIECGNAGGTYDMQNNLCVCP